MSEGVSAGDVAENENQGNSPADGETVPDKVRFENQDSYTNVNDAEDFIISPL